ncbi:MAG: DUF5107 domain-containing protein [Verrucomicrobiota bacterium]
MTAISTDWTFQGLPLIRMENELLRAEILPALGGKIWSLEHRGLRRQFLWHHPRHRLRALPVGANYDDHFFGGFDELLPNDMPERIQGESLVDHGELWTTPLAIRVEGEKLVLSGHLPITPLSYRKTLRLEGNTLLVDYKLANIGRRPLDLLWKMHPALRITPGAEIIVPARVARVADPQFSRRPQPPEFNWPEDKAAHFVPVMDATTEFLYLLELSEGQCALGHRKEDWMFRMSFSREIFSSVWIFASFGGWRNLEVLILEPCTTPRLSLAESTQAGTCLHLEPQAVIETSLRIEVGPYSLS